MTTPLAESAGARWLIVGSTLAIVCGALLPVAILDLNQADSSADWPRVEGVVEASGVRASTSGSGRLGVSTGWSPDVRYRYAVGDRSYAGDVTSFSKGPDDEASARAAAARYPVGARLLVAYDPADASRSVLETGARAADRWPVLALGAGLILALACLWRFRTIRRGELAGGAARAPMQKAGKNPPRRRRRARR